MRATHATERHALPSGCVFWAMTAMRILGLAALLIGLGHRPANGAEVDHLRTVGSSVAIDVDRAVGDVVAVDSYVRVDGVVRGHVFAVDSEIVLKDRSVVLGSLTVNRGRLAIDQGAVLPETIYLNDAGFKGPGGESIDFGQTLALGNGKTRVTLDKTVVSTVSVALLKRLLPFDRFVPGPQHTVASLRDWHPALELELRRVTEGPTEVTVGGIARLTFVSGKVRGVFQRGYRGDRGTVLVTAVQLQDEPSAAALWSQIESAGQRSNLSLSVKTGLGDGAHWFFKRRNRYCMMWQRAHWLIAVETRLADRGADLYQQTQFTEQVLRSMEQQLTQRSALLRGVKK